MKGLVVILSVALIASNISPIHGLAMESIGARVGRCTCLRFSSSVFSPRQIKFIQIIARGIQCPKTQIILTLKNDWKACVSPNAQWVRTLLKNLTKRT